MSQTKCKINGESWIVKTVTDKQMVKLQDDGEEPKAGLAVTDERILYVNKDCVEYRVVAHELWHAYWAGLHLDDTNGIKLADAEEIAANMFAAKAERIVRQAKRIVKELRRNT